MNGNLETGKIVSIVFGPSKGKIGTIVDIIDQKRCLVDGPCGRQIINLKRIEPMKMKLEINKKTKSKGIHEKFLQKRILRSWYNTIKGRKHLKKTYVKNFSDFEKFKFMLGKKHFAKLIQLKK